MKAKWIAMLLMAVAIYLTIISVNLCIGDVKSGFWCGNIFYDNGIDPSAFFQAVSLLQIFIPVVTVFLYVIVFGLLYFTYRGQVQKVTWQKVIGIVCLQSFIIALVGIILFVFYQIVYGYLFDPCIITFYSLLVDCLLANYVYWPYTLLLCIIVVSLLVGLVCFVIRYVYSYRGKESAQALC